jgi:1-phosphofructokinase family hexose kinase
LNAGGKGINVASFLADYGHPAIATGFLGVENDEIFRQLFAQKGIEDRCLRIAGKTRIGVKISDEILHQTTDINFPGQTPGRDDVEQLFAILKGLAVDHDWFVLSGSIPAGVSSGIYGEMVRALAGKKTVLDTSGEGFREAVAARPWLVKPNVDELAEYAGRPLETTEAVLAVARGLIDRHGIATVVVSMGEEGAIFIEGAETVWAVPAPVQVKSTVGAGDAMVAGVVAGKMRGFSLSECARLATAFSMIAVGQIGTGLPSLAALESARERVTLRELSKV